MTAANPYLDTLRKDSAENIRQSLLGAMDKQPDVEARLQALARQYELPVDAVRLDRENIERRARLDAVPYGEIVKSLPATANLLQDPQKAALAHDDIDNLSTLETLLNSFKRGVPALKAMPYSLDVVRHAQTLNELDSIDQALAKNEPPDEAALQKMSIPGYYYGLLKSDAERAQFRARYQPAMQSGLAESAAQLADLQAQRQAVPVPGVVDKVLQAQDFSEAYRQFSRDPVKFVAAVGPESLLQSAPGLLAALPKQRRDI